MMPAKVTGGAYYGFDNWQGYPQEREELLGHIKDEGIDDVVFITGDIHLFLAGDVRTDLGNGESVAVEFVGGSITSQNFGETNVDAGGGVVIPGNDANPNTSPSIINALRAFNPWIDQADFDHHGYALVEASRTRIRLHAQARRDDQAALARDADHEGVHVPPRRAGRSRSRASTARRRREPPPPPGAARRERDARGGRRRHGGGRAVPARHRAPARPGGAAREPVGPRRPPGSGRSRAIGALTPR